MTSPTYYKAKIPFILCDEVFHFDVVFAYWPEDRRDIPTTKVSIEIVDVDMSDAMDEKVVSTIVQYLFDNRDVAEYVGNKEDAECLAQH